MSKIVLLNGSCADQDVDVVVNAANGRLWAGGGICGVIFNKAGMGELTAACNKHKTPVKDGGAVITPAFNLKNAKAIIVRRHIVGGKNCTLISVSTPPRPCRTGTRRRLSAA